MGKQRPVRIISYRLRCNFHALQLVLHFFDICHRFVAYSAGDGAGAILVIALAVIGISFAGMGKPLDETEQTMVSIEIPSGSTAGSIASTLEENNIIDSASEFTLWSKMKGYDSRFKAGTYALSAAMDFETIADILVGGKVSMAVFTVPEGLTLEQTIEKLVAQKMGTKENFENEVKDKKWFDKYEFLRYASYEDAMRESLEDNYLEGYLMPNTYYVAEGASEEEVIDVMLSQFNKDVFEGIFKGFLAEYDNTVLKKYGDHLNTEQGFQLRDVVKYASIIERETVLDDERPLVSAVIYNRLEKGMRLQMCSTVQYILGYQKANLTYADISNDYPYNTYLYDNIPGPICSPGLASIKAAFYPEDTDYLYFVVSEKLDGSMNFSSDAAQFERDKAAYSKAYSAAHS